MIDNGTVSSVVIVDTIASEIVVNHDQVYHLSGMTVETILGSVRRTYVTESDVFVVSLLRIVK